MISKTYTCGLWVSINYNNELFGIIYDNSSLLKICLYWIIWWYWWLIYHLIFQIKYGSTDKKYFLITLTWMQNPTFSISNQNIYFWDHGTSIDNNFSSIFPQIWCRCKHKWYSYLADCIQFSITAHTQDVLTKWISNTSIYKSAFHRLYVKSAFHSLLNWNPSTFRWESWVA